MIKKILQHISTLGSIGYLPAPGTMGTIAALPLIFALHTLNMGVYAHVLFAILFACISVLIIHISFDKDVLDNDPGSIILDEVAGVVVTFLCVPFSIKNIIIGTILFRIFDIAKPFGIQKVERFKGAFGIVLDDVMAALLSNIALQLIIKYLL